MSTTDRAAFESHWPNAAKERDGDTYDSTIWECRWEGWQAATEAAKATSVAVGELPEPDYKAGSKGMLGEDAWARETIEAYGQQCAEAARQPAPALPVKTWEERYADDRYARQDHKTKEFHMQHEIEDLRAALAATAAPVLSGKPKEGEKGWRPACCDGGGEGSPCCDFGGCAANNELAEMREEANRSQP